MNSESTHEYMPVRQVGIGDQHHITMWATAQLGTDNNSISTLAAFISALITCLIKDQKHMPMHLNRNVLREGF